LVKGCGKAGTAVEGIKEDESKEDESKEENPGGEGSEEERTKVTDEDARDVVGKSGVKGALHGRKVVLEKYQDVSTAKPDTSRTSFNDAREFTTKIGSAQQTASHYEKQEGSKGTLVLEHDSSIHGFYRETLSLFQSSLKHRGWCNRCLIGETKFKAEHCLSLLYIWAQGLDLPHFERRVDTDFGLQELVAGSLASIARIVLSGKLCSCPFAIVPNH
jgi:hypothetical protein